MLTPELNLLLVGAPNYLPAQPVHAREIELWLEGGPPDPDPKAGTLPELSDRRLGLPPGTLGNPPRSTGRPSRESPAGSATRFDWRR